MGAESIPLAAGTMCRVQDRKVVQQMVRPLTVLIFFVSYCLLPFGHCAVAQNQPSEIELRILTYNIHHGAGMDKRIDLERIAKTILSVKPDLVALQEVDVETARSMKVHQIKRLAELTKMNFAFGPNIEFSGGQFGNAVLSRHPIEKSKNYKLPNHRDGEQRGLLCASIKMKNLKENINLWATHFDHRRDDSERVASAKFCNQKLTESKSGIHFLAGDINDVIGSNTLNELEKSWARSNSFPLPTIPVGNPERQIDFVFSAKRSGLVCVHSKVLPESVASDHRALLAIYRIGPEKE